MKDWDVMTRVLLGRYEKAQARSDPASRIHPSYRLETSNNQLYLHLLAANDTYRRYIQSNRKGIETFSGVWNLNNMQEYASNGNGI